VISVPTPRKCSNRNIEAPKHPNVTDASEWFSNNYLPKNYYTLSFDFFVNWNTYKISNEIWLKRTVNQKAYSMWPTLNRGTVQSALDSCEGKDNLIKLVTFASKFNFLPKYHIFKDSMDWVNYPASFISSELNIIGDVVNVTKNALPFIMNEIIRLSGKKMYVGKKGLGYACTALECHLANNSTGAAWPGDVDGILFDDRDTPIAIIEYKKNTIGPEKFNHTPITNEKLSNFYSTTGWAKDNNKYNRLAILRDYIGGEALPIIVVYYPAWQSYKDLENIIKLEKIGGKVNQLISLQDKYLQVPKSQQDKTNIINTLVKML